MLKEKVGVKEWQLNRVSDGFDLRTQTANIVIRDIRDIFEHEVFDLGAREFLERDFVRSIDPHGITRAQHLAAKCIADRYDSFLSARPLTTQRSTPSTSTTDTIEPVC